MLVRNKYLVVTSYALQNKGFKRIVLGLSKFWTFFKSCGYCSLSHACDPKNKTAKRISEIGHRFAPPHRLQNFPLQTAIIREFRKVKYAFLIYRFVVRCHEAEFWLYIVCISDAS